MSSSAQLSHLICLRRGQARLASQRAPYALACPVAVLYHVGPPSQPDFTHSSSSSSHSFQHSSPTPARSPVARPLEHKTIVFD